MWWYLLASVGLLIIAVLGVYAGKLIFQLQAQTQKQQAARAQRVETILESIHTISRAMQQQQCNVSEGAIRICRLFAALPDTTPVDYKAQFPAIHALFVDVSGFSILADRKALTKQQRFAEDKAREIIEEQHESIVLRELPAIIAYCETRQPSLANSQVIL
ncbi:DUF2489 domain-containing protein [Alteromonas sp. AMM-1]|uniref:DUF2489 domain-containing protein n=1 Tax=Alteromonas sp. AMM-1 TaxID=3394233 RepID=UPI0039A672AF